MKTDLDTAPAAGLQVLLLDDDAFMLELLADMITDLGPHQVRGETDGKRGLAALAAMAPAPDLLICDLSMPDMDGIEFLRHAAGLGFRGSVVLLSGADPAVLRAAERLGAAQGLAMLEACPKPLAHDKLESLLQRAVARLN